MQPAYIGSYIRNIWVTVPMYWAPLAGFLQGSCSGCSCSSPSASVSASASTSVSSRASACSALLYSAVHVYSTNHSSSLPTHAHGCLSIRLSIDTSKSKYSTRVLVPKLRLPLLSLLVAESGVDNQSVISGLSKYPLFFLHRPSLWLRESTGTYICTPAVCTPCVLE